MKPGVLFALGLLFAVPVLADDQQQQPRDWYWGVKAGFLDPDAPNSDPAINAGGFVGMHFRQIEGFAVEADGTITLVDGDVNGRDFDSLQLGGFAVWRSSGDIYFKGKGGLLFFDFDDFVVPDTDVEFGLGAGVGFPINRGRDALEVEIVFTDDVNFLTVGYRFD